MNVFISYSHKDTPFKDRLMTHLAAFRKENSLDLWHDKMIGVGEDWRGEIGKALKRADAAILLISADFLASDFISHREVPLFLERRAGEGLRMIPVIIRPCPWKKITWLSAMRAIHLEERNTGPSGWLFKLFGSVFKNREMEKDCAFVAEKVHEALELEKTAISIQKPRKPERPRAGALNLSAPVFIEIKTDNGRCTGRVHQGGGDKTFPLPEPKLDRKVKPLDDHTRTLGDIMDSIMEFDPKELKNFDERVQLELGQYLYDQTLGGLPEKEQDHLRQAKGLDLRILCDNEWIAGLPWNLLADRGIFRCTTGWSVSVARRSENPARELPPSPRLLVVAPRPAGLADTKAKDHLEDLEDMLSSHDPLLSFDNHIRVAGTWEDFVRLVEEFKPQLVYYYGHGEGDGKRTRLILAEEKTRKPVDKPMDDFALCLRNMEKPPLLVYVNCCLGDAGGFLGAGMQLGAFVPAVITNRATAYITTAQSQAMALWKNILLRAVPPHRAVATLYARMTDQNLSAADIRWITPVFHCHYRQWKAAAPTPPDRLTDDPHWHLKIDRVSQFSYVVAQSRLMLREKKPKSLVFVWYGREGQGIEVFHKRVWVELREDLSNTFVYPVRPAWPPHLENYDTAFGGMLARTFEVAALEDIPGRIRSESYGESGKQTLVYVRHEPVRAANLINPASLKGYVEWWDNEFVPKLQKNQFALLCVSFIVKNPPAFVEYMEKEKFDDLDLRHTVFWLLDEMETVAKKDLLLFLRTHNIRLPMDRRDKVLRKILKKTGGQYEQTIEELKMLRRDAWGVDEESEGMERKSGETKFDY